MPFVAWHYRNGHYVRSHYRRLPWRRADAGTPPLFALAVRDMPGAPTGHTPPRTTRPQSRQASAAADVTTRMLFQRTHLPSKR